MFPFMAKLNPRLRKLLRAFRPLSLAGLAAAMGCAGPTTPLGASRALTPSQVNAPRLSFLGSVLRQKDSEDDASVPGPGEPTVLVYPARQVLHGPAPITVVIHEPGGIDALGHNPIDDLVIRHNGLDVTASFLMQAHTEKGHSRLVVRVPAIRLSPLREHVIEVIYGRAGRHAYARVKPPRCSVREDRSVFSTGGFRPSTLLLRQIHELARERHVNPALLAGLIAQESGFEPKRVSWARAMGLTQVTGVAERELAKRYPEFASYPRYPGINEMPFGLLQALIATGTVNEQNEWRLDAGRSIRGGLAYLALLERRWNSPENRRRVLRVFGPEEFDQALTKLILASYHSGYARVSSTLSRSQYSWMHAADLQEARRYIGSIFSYCDHFADPEPELYHENET